MRTLRDLFELVVSTLPPHKELQRVRVGQGWRTVTVREFEQATRATAARLAEVGVSMGDRVALFVENRPEWHWVDFACHLLGAVPVPLYATLPASQVRYIVADSGARVLLVSGRERARVAVEAVHDLPGVRVIGIDPGLHPDVLCLSDLALPRKAPVWPSLEPGDLASLIYTSGTTGEPKGVMLTHGNFASQVVSATPLFPITQADVVMSFLPLSHVYERTVDYIFLKAGAQITYVESIERVPTQLPEIRPTIMVSVPRLFERSYIKIISKLKQEGGAKRRLFEWALRVGREVRESEWRGQRASAFLRGQLKVARARIFSKVLERLGGRLRFCISGGAPLAREVAEFFDILGLPILQGYGLTETSPIIATNLIDSNRIGSVGRVLPGVEARIAPDGEILARGPNIMQGYWNKPEPTAEAIDADGWLHTGDVGYLDADGYLFITDRKKDIIVTSGGKNVAPQPLEARLGATPLIAQAVLIGDKFPYLVSLVVPNFENLEAHLAAAGVKGIDRAAMAEHPLTQAAIGAVIKSLNSELAMHERIRRFTVLTRELSLEEGELTPTMKVRRRVIAERYHDRIEAMYLKTQRAGDYELED
ncbi:MAG: long-chain fatty acid--CoA ligase [Thermoanaerobaculaceae bacterium]|jgi:long-chain acyl-CoA synthetase|nr:long-chain fatty acid--CoA ligase [Thermoanaerobaculaceae bacterium]